MDTAFTFQYIPLAWYNEYPFAQELSSSVHMSQDIRSLAATPPPPYSERSESTVHLTDSKESHVARPIIYATVRPSLFRLNTIHPSPPSSPRTPMSLNSGDESDPSSPTSERCSASDQSLIASPFATRALRRSRRRPRGLSLREVRLKESEADLKRVYSSTVESYLTGEIFNNFKPWLEPVISEETSCEVPE